MPRLHSMVEHFVPVQRLESGGMRWSSEILIVHLRLRYRLLNLREQRLRCGEVRT